MTTHTSEPTSGWTLGVDTSTAVCVGLSRGEEVISLRDDNPRAHAEQLMPLVERACVQAGIAVGDIAEVSVGVGPGPYTGLRVGIVTARLIAHLAGTELHPVCSLDILARQWADAGTAPAAGFVVATDARRHELYWARYDAAGQRTDGPHVTAPDQLPDGLPVGGPGCPARGLTPAEGAPEQLDAGVLAASWTRMPDVGLEPLYLRDPDATVPTTRKATLTPARLTLPAALRG
ncbi:Universal bacterial protein YeaZ [Acidipropionibacterium acidipropionici ATCC 4875]|uniref:Universal bacterial protein YeaZ n=1 Tax=Acidipropionibacterium acidipropionici (strain ATCC 4875 / DSM 20272 / JCM 6432 / NBRC 12425 / NCIMB 8070 / 4) TaxID=1171373 RepID=K7SM58_ACIA4|nr:tRNA (adenosine(37)-N6)-threonylcarbamoyltransferase complex dimerization subunit type 1 TsaB [Acidipropionibacterium acidipropionici]AFV90280.1 Universal bacterial protein YeaZ [Acidipropionibacterium acidipropionici ATCC 4875]ALN15467.1 tRNA threonylcarbamoyladenosine biosynthesis protein TsaB [Acidipropionibacterium acidipropionici]APZ08785.1 tRNA (adenosine(37)-N6)-threonylcarbamoyltransferase complex dimerization subunit type 1 TsaB [Acidipropionibacterium acidipropionici]